MKHQGGTERFTSVSRSRVCTDEFIGCQPTLEELESIWELALKGFDNPNKKVLIVHYIDGKEIVRQETLSALVAEAGTPSTLDNLAMTAKQDSPARNIEIRIGPGRETTVTVEADDHTWAIGRHIEIMERFAQTQKKYSLARNNEVLVSSKDRIQEKGFDLRKLGIALSKFALSGIGVVALYIGLAFLVALTFGVPYIIVDNQIHHRRIPHNTIVALPFSVAADAVIVAALMFAIKAAQSKVAIQKRSFWTADNKSLATTLTAIIGAIIGLIGLMIK